MRTLEQDEFDLDIFEEADQPADGAAVRHASRPSWTTCRISSRNSGGFERADSKLEALKAQI